MKPVYPHNFTRNRPPGIGTEKSTPSASKNSLWPFAFVFALGLLLLSGIASATTSLSNVQSGQLLFKTDNELLTAPTLESHAKLVINGPIARVVLSQTFQNTTDQWQEAIYAFPLVEDAAVDGLIVKIGNRVIEGEIQEKLQAKKTYEQAKQLGKVTGLVEQNRPNLFTTSVANIPPHEEVAIEIRYQQTIGFSEGVFSLRFPMTVTPRYTPTTAIMKGVTAPTFETADSETMLAPPPMMGDDVFRLNLISLDIELDAGMSLMDVTSQHHPILTNDVGAGYQIQLQDGKVPMDRDFELSWRPHVGVTPEATMITEEVNGSTYAMLMVYPPSETANYKTPQNREMILVIDSSGSMGGVSIVQAKAALRVALEKLKPGDFFNIVDFDSDARRLFDHSKPVMQNTLEEARKFISGLTADGGTEMHRALALALAKPSDLGLLRQVIFVTDGSVGNEEALFNYIQKNLAETRLFTVGIGSAPNMYFMRSAARFGRGTYTYIGAQDQVSQKMTQLFDKLESPALTDVKMEFGVAAAEVWPDRIPDLYKGEPLFFTAKLPVSSAPSAQITGALSQSPWKRRLNFDQPKQSAGIAKYWARQKIAALMDQKVLGKDPELIRSEVLPLALEHGLVTRYTSLVAVEQTPSNPTPGSIESKKVPNHVPAGMQYPSTATFWPLKLMFGFILTLWAATLLTIYRRRRVTI